MSIDYGLECGLRLAFFVFDVFAVGDRKLPFLLLTLSHV